MYIFEDPEMFYNNLLKNAPKNLDFRGESDWIAENISQQNILSTYKKILQMFHMELEATGSKYLTDKASRYSAEMDILWDAMDDKTAKRV